MSETTSTHYCVRPCLIYQTHSGKFKSGTSELKTNKQTKSKSLLFKLMQNATKLCFCIVRKMRFLIILWLLHNWIGRPKKPKENNDKLFINLHQTVCFKSPVPQQVWHRLVLVLVYLYNLSNKTRGDFLKIMFFSVLLLNQKLWNDEINQQIKGTQAVPECVKWESVFYFNT